MGLFSFIKDAGAKVFGIGKTTEEEAAEAVVIANRKAAVTMSKTINDLGLQVEGLQINIDKDTAVVSGKALNQETKEKVVLVVGNSHGIASVNDQMQVEIVEVEAQFHSVVTGDTLGKIAKKYYDNAMKYPVIFEANKPMLTHPDKIYVGQVLRIPAID